MEGSKVAYDVPVGEMRLKVTPVTGWHFRNEDLVFVTTKADFNLVREVTRINQLLRGRSGIQSVHIVCASGVVNLQRQILF